MRIECLSDRSARVLSKSQYIIESRGRQLIANWLPYDLLWLAAPCRVTRWLVIPLIAEVIRERKSLDVAAQRLRNKLLVSRANIISEPPTIEAFLLSQRLAHH